MLNLAEILTIIIGLLLALVFVDGIRRSIRTRKNKLKVDLVQPSASEAEESVDTFVPTNDETEFLDELEEPVEDIPILKGHALIIFNLCSKDSGAFSFTTLSNGLSSYNFLFEDRGFFTFRGNSGEILFSIINAKTPGNFLEEKSLAFNSPLLLDTKFRKFVII